MNLTNLGSQARHFARRLSPFHTSLHTHLPDSEHLDYCRRKFFSPFTQVQDVLNLLQNDHALMRSYPTSHREHLLRVAICGYELRVNIYRINEVESEDQIEIFDPQWFNTGHFDFLANTKSELTPVTRSIPDLYYNPYDPLVSYARPLTDGEWDDLRPLVMKRSFAE